MAVLFPTEIDEHDEDENNKEGGHTTAETCPIELEARCSCRLVNDLILIGLLLVGLLVCRFTFGTAHVVAAVFFSSRFFRAGDRVMGPLGCCEPVDVGRSIEHVPELFGCKARSSK